MWPRAMRLMALFVLLQTFKVLSNDQFVEDSSLPWCSPNNLNISSTGRGEFIAMPDGSLRYETHHCRLRRFTADDTVQCLTGTHLVFMGDSLSRYFYLSLASLLASGQWPKPFLEDWPESRGLFSEVEHNSWEAFYEYTNRALNNETGGAVELCDCHRNSTVPWDIRIRTMFENRHFRLTPRQRDQLRDDVRLTFIQWFGHMPMRGHQAISLLSNDSPQPLSSISTARASQQPKAAPATDRYRASKHQLCPLGNASFWPLSADCTDQRPDILTIDFPDFVNSYYKSCANFSNRHVRFINNLQVDLDLSSSTAQDSKIVGSNSLAGPFINNLCQRFEREVLGAERGIQATHLLLNIGWHTNLNQLPPPFIAKVVDAGEKYFATTSRASRDRLRLPRVTWREATAGALFENGDIVARQYSLYLQQQRDQQREPSLSDSSSQELGYFAIQDITKNLRRIERALRILGDPKQHGLHHQSRSTLNQLRTHNSWPADRPVNNETVHTIWYDHAHFEPYVYTEIHNVFLNAVCVLPPPAIQTRPSTINGKKNGMVKDQAKDDINKLMNKQHKLHKTQQHRQMPMGMSEGEWIKSASTNNAGGAFDRASLRLKRREGMHRQSRQQSRSRDRGDRRRPPPKL